MLTSTQPAATTPTEPQRRTAALALAALGIVFGDIGTSPLYTLSTCFQFSGAHPTPPNVLGICSLLVWVLIVVVCFKYVGCILFADHDGEGGILALLALPIDGRDINLTAQDHSTCAELAFAAKARARRLARPE